MQNVPKIVQARLQRPTPATAESHPDADLLTAFAEQSLAGRERDQVVEHLARCGDCREVVSLALPAEVELPELADSGADWFRWPVLRWAAVAAGVAIIASIGTVQYRRRHSTELASNVFHPKQAITTPAQTPQPSSQAAVPQTRMQKDGLAAPRAQSALAEGKPAPSANAIFPQPMRRANSAGAFGGVGAGAGSGSGGQSPKAAQVTPRSDSFAFAPASKSAMPAATAKQNPVPEAGQQVVVPSASEVVEVQSEAAQITTTAQNQPQDQLIQNQKEQPLQNRSFTNLDVVGKAKDPVPAQAASSPASAPPLAPPNISLQTAPSLLLRASPRWTISSTGTLQRSFDAGKTWEDVNVNPASVASRSQVEIVAGDKHEKKKKDEAQPNPNLVFRAVAAIGPEVWAGGSGATLYHSVDSGARWSRVLPSAAGAVLTGDIIGVEFSDPQHGRVTTSAGEVWTTADDGQTWHKQQ